MGELIVPQPLPLRGPVSPIRNLFGKYSFSLFENPALLVWASLRAQSICNCNYRAGALIRSCGILSKLWPPCELAFKSRLVSTDSFVKQDFTFLRTDMIAAIQVPLQCRKPLIELCAAFFGTFRHVQISLFSEGRLESGGSPLAFWDATEIVVDLDLRAENWSHISFSAEPVDNRAI